MSGMLRFTEEGFAAFLKTSTARVAPEPQRRTKPATPAPTGPTARRPISTAKPASRREAAASREAPGAAGPKESEIERRFAQQIRAAGLPEPEREYYHITGRNFRLDFAWPAIKLGVEVQGMAHRIKGKFHADMEKRILAQMNGWLVMEISGDMVRHDTAIAWLVILVGQRAMPPNASSAATEE